MSQPSSIQGDQYFLGLVTFAQAPILPSGSGTSFIVDANIAANAAIQSTKSIQRFWKDEELFGPTTAIAALTKRILRMTAPGTVINGSVDIQLAATTGQTVTIDIQKSTAQGAYASILTAPLVLNSATAIGTAIPLTFTAGAAMVLGDMLRVVVTIGGAGGNQAQGLGLTLTVDRNPQ